MLNRFFRPQTEVLGLDDAAANSVGQKKISIKTSESSTASSGSSSAASSQHSSIGPLNNNDGGIAASTPASLQPTRHDSSPQQDRKVVHTPSSHASDDLTTKAMAIVAKELAVDARMLTDDAKIAAFGLDSLMSLVLSPTLRDQLKTEIRDAFFPEVETFVDLKKSFR